jgi:dTDP-4-dehydrorhamnose reductase
VKILLLGAHGQLGRSLAPLLASFGELQALTRAELDLHDLPALRQCLRRERPQLVVNAAAWTAVEQAEGEPQAAFALNAAAPAALAEEAAALGAWLLHYSTDYVFDGRLGRPYREDDACAPLNVYGQSKRAGEQAIVAAGGKALILRTSWLYSRHGRNFLLTMQRLLRERAEVRVVADQFGNPTSCAALAAASLALVARIAAGNPGPGGLYHASCTGGASWYELAEAIAADLRARGEPCARLLPIAAADYPSAVARPADSRLDCSALQRDWGVALPDWRTALAACLAGPA